MTRVGGVMAKRFSLLLKNGRIVSPAGAVETVSDMDGIADIALCGGEIAEIGRDLNPDLADETVDLSGKVLIPGIIDAHVHVSPVFGGLEGHRMLARAGVTTAVDRAGPSMDVFRGLKTHGTGLNFMSVEAMIPGRQLSCTAPSRKELATNLERAMGQGSLGMKILGEPYPLTPEATVEAITLCAERGCCCSVHAGTTRNPSNFHGFCEILELAGDVPFYLAHINVYCRGATTSSAEEGALALALLAERPSIVTDSYLSPDNACSAKIVDGRVKSPFMRTALQQMGFSEDEKGVRQALLADRLGVAVALNGERVLLSGPRGVDAWRKAGTRIDAFASVNPFDSRIGLALGRHQQGEHCGEFIVGSLCSDGGGLVRNVLVESGLALVWLGGLSLSDLVRKISINPASMLGLSRKGQLLPGMDADITVLDLERGKAISSIVSGRFVLRDGVVCGSGGTALVREEGCRAMQNLGIATRCL